MLTMHDRRNTPKLDTLPPEVLDQVLIHLPDDYTSTPLQPLVTRDWRTPADITVLKECVRVNKAFAAQVQPIINRTAHLTANNLGPFLKMLDTKTVDCRQRRLAEIQDLSIDDFGISKRQDEQIPRLMEMVSGMSLIRLSLSARIRPLSDGEPARWVERLAVTASVCQLRYLRIAALGQHETAYLRLLSRSAATLRILHVSDLTSIPPKSTKITMPVFKALLKVTYEAGTPQVDSNEPILQLVDILENSTHIKELRLLGFHHHRLRCALKACRLNVREVYLDDDASPLFNEDGHECALDVAPRLAKLHVLTGHWSFNVKALPRYCPHLQELTIDYISVELKDLLDLLIVHTNLATLRTVCIGAVHPLSNSQKTHKELEDICRKRHLKLTVGKMHVHG